MRVSLGYTTLQRDLPLTVRGWLLPDAADTDRGAFGRLLSAIAASAGLPAVDASLVDLALIREWITDARQSDLIELRGRLEPHWTSPPTGPVEIPDDLPRDDVEPIDPGPLGPLGP